MNAFKKYATRFIGLLVTAVPTCVACAHGAGPWGRALDWRTEHIDQVVAIEGMGEKIAIEGRNCLAGGSLGFKVNDDYAFDIDETVFLDIEFYVGGEEAKIQIGYNRNNAEGETLFAQGGVDLALPGSAQGHWYRKSIALDHARFANLGFDGSDFTITSNVSDHSGPGSFRLCSLSLRRSYTTAVPQAFGTIAIQILDEQGHPTPARVGLYDSSGRLPLPGKDALTLNNGTTDAGRIVALGGMFNKVLPLWPAKNRAVFYADGRYSTRLPVGSYDLIVAKGLEYRLYRQRLTIRADTTNAMSVQLKRWTDMASQGWYSGEGHIHYGRNAPHDDRDLLLLTRAEDLKVANILQYDNAAYTLLPHYDWTTVPSQQEPSFVLVPGQEAPRTNLFGHTELLNIKAPIRDPDHYLSYHHAFEQAHEQGGLVGYAHAVGYGCDEFDLAEETYPTCEVRSMVLDVPFGLVDFAEVQTGETTGTPVWFDFLNLGYNLSPAAGTDYPFGGVPGSVRNYVEIDGPFSPQAWFDGLKQGRTFVTAGPMLELSVNGRGIGAELHVKRGEPLRIEAKARINPDLDDLMSLELIEQGDIVKVASSSYKSTRLKLDLRVGAQHGTWFVVRARGRNSHMLGLSAPIYVFVDGDSFWNRSAVRGIVGRMKGKMQEMMKPDQIERTGPGTQEAFNRYWETQKGELKQRIAKATALYDDLLKRAATAPDQP